MTKYLDDHPGGAEVMLDVAGQDADEFFEDIGHSKEAREELKRHYIGEFHLDEAAKAQMAAAALAKQEQVRQRNNQNGSLAFMGVIGLIVAVVVAVIAMGYHQTITTTTTTAES